VTEAARTLVFRLPRLSYLAVFFLLLCVTPLALVDDPSQSTSAGSVSWRLVLLVIPVLAAVFIARTATFVSRDGVRVRAVLGSRSLPWDSIRGLSLDARSVYAVQDDGAVRLPCVRVADLATIAKVSEGRLPAIAEPVRKFAPSRRRR
jgi:hypothetical protein